MWHRDAAASAHAWARVVHGAHADGRTAVRVCAQSRFGRDLLVVVLHLLSNPSCRHEVGASWTDVAVTLVAGIGGPVAEVAGLVARPLPLGEMARVVALGPGCRRCQCPHFQVGG